MYSSLFSVSNFAAAAELMPILAKIPPNGNPELYEELREQGQGPSRAEGAAIVNMMSEFKLTSEKIYHINLPKLDAAHSLLADRQHPRYCSLFEIASALLPTNSDSGNDLSPPALYAVHTALLRQHFCFHPLSPSRYCHRRDHIFEVTPLNRVDVIDRVVAMTRSYVERISADSQGPMQEENLARFEDFILAARKAVLNNRACQSADSSSIPDKPVSESFDPVAWSTSSKEIISFIEWWASYDLFTTGSRFQSYGPIILRALDLYEGLALDRATAWRFLQEIGFIPAWEIPSRYSVRFPQTAIVRGGGLSRPAPENLNESIRTDIAVDARKDLADGIVYCIDGPDTTIVDDGISLEKTDDPEKFWIHVHTADPASIILPGSSLSKFLELIPETIYLPGHFQAMLPSEVGEDDSADYRSESIAKGFSLHAGAPALTFSGLVNTSGDLLDYKVEPSIINNVKYLDPEDVSRFCNEPPPRSVRTDYLAVGKHPDTPAAASERNMISTDNLDEVAKNDLQTLYRLSGAVKNRRLERGAWPYFFPRPSVSVRFGKAPDGVEVSQESAVSLADPYIEVSYGSSTGCSVVSNSMVLAGEVAARWCSSRGIPVPYRRDLKTAQNFSAAFEYATKEIYPLIEKGLEPTSSHREELLGLTGGVEIATQPGPYFILGIDMYAKATSPLRRFADLILHWQVHAALAHERKVGRRLDPSVDSLDEILPFPHAELSELLPVLEMREKMCRTVGRGVKDWVLQALSRARLYGDKMPRTFTFTVQSRLVNGAYGTIDFFDLQAAIDIDGLNGISLIRDLKIGDKFEVELRDISVHSQDIYVSAIRKLDSPGQGDGGSIIP